MERGYEIKVLDHGYVRLIDYMGSDQAVVESARMSTGRNFVSWEPYSRCKRCNETWLWQNGQIPSTCRRGELMGASCDSFYFEHFNRGDLGILEFMYANKHMTPFECGGEMMVEVQAPIFVFREWHRHRTQSYSEFSARYSQMPNLHFLPELSRFQLQSQTDRQNSSPTIMDRDVAQAHCEVMKTEQLTVYDHYDEMIDLGLAKEVARINTPVSRYSRMRAKTDLRNWLGFLLLRKAPNAQLEIRQYADALAEMVKFIWPRTYALFEEHDMYGVQLSREEARAVMVALMDGKVDMNTPAQMTRLQKKLERAYRCSGE